MERKNLKKTRKDQRKRPFFGWENGETLNTQVNMPCTLQNHHKWVFHTQEMSR